MAISLRDVRLRQIEVRTRMPFRYGIATLTAAPYLLVFADFEIDGQPARGVAADILPPKWFTKRPDAALDDEIAEMIVVIRRACDHAREVVAQATVYDWWRQLYERQMSDDHLIQFPPLLRGFGASLLERAAIDAYCRDYSLKFADAVRENRLGLRLGDFHQQLAAAEPRSLLPSEPSRRMKIRHTVGLADPVTTDQIAAGDRIADGLPQSLDECIRRYGLTHFKIKLPAIAADAVARLRDLAAIIQRDCAEYAFTLDGNEFFADAQMFRDYWQQLSSDKQVRAFLDRGLLLIEQPLHRDVALQDDVREVLSVWRDRPPVIIDESDAQLDSFALALAAGYDGTSHKNCKGVFKGIANACLVHHVNQQSPDRNLLMTGEDLMNIGPVALLQDLAVGATIGLTHMERNGHHYVAGLSPFGRVVQDEVLSNHADLYESHNCEDGRDWPAVRVRDGAITLDSIVTAPFGYAMELKPSDFDHLED